jgi:hypothetical protein
VLTRKASHWSQRVSDGNPRGYSEKQKQNIADADTLVKKWRVELKVMRDRLKAEMNLKVPVDDENGVDRINVTIADINGQYAAMGVNVGVTHDAVGVVAGTDDDEIKEEEESDSDHEPRQSKKFVC